MLLASKSRQNVAVGHILFSTKFITVLFCFTNAMYVIFENQKHAIYHNEGMNLWRENMSEVIPV
jgi:hypothetical protein